MKRSIAFATIMAAVLTFAGTAGAHFGMAIPSDSMPAADGERSVSLELSFSHPFEMIGMELEKPASFVVVRDGETTDLLPGLKPAVVLEKKAWRTDYAIRRPGAHIFVMEPRPYWEPAEDAFIVHYTKTVVAAFGDDEGWDAEIGLKTEIVPLSRPFGLYAGNLFQGIVKVDGKPAPYAEVEIECYNRDGNRTAPSDLMITQTVKADGNGVFSYVAPWAGWWGFAALSEADFTLTREGEEKPVEIGGVLWVHFEPTGN